METKPPWMSKTMWVALVMAIVAFFPPVAKLISENPEMFAAGMGAIFAVLRYVSKGKIVIE